MQLRSAASIVLTLGVALAAISASAQPPSGLSGKVAFGYLATSGNSENNNMNLGFAAAYDAAPWQHSLNGLAVKASSSNVDTAEAYALAWKSRYNITDTYYMFGLVAWDKDKFSGYDQQLREVIGVGRRFIDRERHVLNAEAGVGARQADLRDGTSQDDSILRLATDYHWAISDTAEFIQLFSIEQGSDNTHMESVSSLSADILENTAIVLSYTIKNNSDVPLGTQKRDTFTAISLEYSF